ncbi:DUF559 domain-containing protein [Microcoleus sp. ZQ-A2]|nr:endonuclease domain-containing protein [Microcoleus sp. FACHB-1]
MQKDSLRIRGTTKPIEQSARRLRQQLTPAEAYLWSALNRRQLAGLKFRSQHPVGRFIFDFYCPSCKLVIEVDGDIHAQQKAYDDARTQQLQNFGYRVLRFTNEEVLSDLLTVLAHIVKVAEAPIKLPSHAGSAPLTDQLWREPESQSPPVLGDLGG